MGAKRRLGYLSLLAAAAVVVVGVVVKPPTSPPGVTGVRDVVVVPGADGVVRGGLDAACLGTLLLRGGSLWVPVVTVVAVCAGVGLRDTVPENGTATC